MQHVLQAGGLLVLVLVEVCWGRHRHRQGQHDGGGGGPELSMNFCDVLQCLKKAPN